MINIAIDGPSAAGKSTIAKLLAKHLNYIHIDTGAMYRCCAYASVVRNIAIDDETGLSKMMNAIVISFDSLGNVLLDGEDVSTNIRTNDISMLASKISQYPFVREKLVDIQKTIAKQKGYILDGRDIGTVVLPDAEVKIFLIASVEARAKRRYKEYEDKQIEANYQEIYDDIEKRDYQDMNREISPLKKADDAIEIDTSDLTIQEVIEKIINVIEKI